MCEKEKEENISPRRRQYKAFDLGLDLDKREYVMAVMRCFIDFSCLILNGI